MLTGRILVVNDEESVAITISAILEMEGHTVSTAVRSADAFALIHEHGRALGPGGR